MSARPVLAQRVLTTALLLPVVVAGVLWLPAPWFALGIALFAGVAAWEWGRLAGWRASLSRIIYAALTLGLAALIARAGAWEWTAPLLLLAGCGWWVVALVWVVRYQQGEEPLLMNSPLVAAVVGWLMVLPAWYALVAVHRSWHGVYKVLLLFVVIWVADTGAYFAGRAFGRHRLASRVSPGKTWEGFAGALAVVVLATLLTERHAGNMGVIWLPAQAIAVVGVSVIGDLTESLFKRRAGRKDSGGLLPGHGGVLDRIDSLIAAAPVFALFLYLTGNLS